MSEIAKGEIRALTFDVFGTVVDWRGGVARAAEAVLAPKGHALDWGAFADGWHHQMHALLDDLRIALGWALSPKGDEALGEALAVKVVFLLYELSLVDECCAWARRALDSVAATHHGSRSTRHAVVLSETPERCSG